MEEGGFLNSNSFSPFLPSPVSASEEEPIDSFDVHPQSGRWENILDDAIVDRITDSQLEVLVVNNETSGVDGFEMNRGTTKTDGKFEWRSKAEGSGNQTEYFRDVIGDEADFTEGDKEIFTTVVGTPTITVNNAIIRIELDDNNEGIGSVEKFIEWGLIYHTIEIRAKANIAFTMNWWADTEFPVGDNGFTIDLTTEWTTFTIDASSFIYDNDGTVFYSRDTEFPKIIDIKFIKVIGDYDFATHVEGEIEDTWDFEEGDLEGWSAPFGNDFAAKTVSNGLLVATAPAVASVVFAHNFDFDDHNLNFNLLQIRIKGNESGLTLQPTNWNDFQAIGTRETISTDFTIIEWDLSDDSNYFDTGNTVFYFSFQDGSGNFEGNENITIDYILLLGEFSEIDSVIGLMDSDKNPLLNISTHFFGNNTARFEFELLDATGELSYHWYSDLFGDLDEIFVIGKCSFDVLRSRLEITLTAENNSRIDKITFPNEFIEDSGLIPALFANVISPDIFVSTFTVDHSWQKLFLDWIKVDFKRAEWVQTDNPTDSDWLEDRWDIARVQDDISDDSAWDLYVPYLDTVSASITTQFENQSAINDNDLAGVGFQLIGVDWDDGDEHAIYQLSVLQFRADDGGLKLFTEGAILENGTPTVKDFEYNAFPLAESPRLSFSMSLSEERSIASCKVRFWHNRSDLTDFFDLVAEINITTSPFQDISQEFILRTSFTADLLADNEFVGMVEDFGFTDLDIFQDIANAVIEPIGNFLQTIFTAAFKFLADIFRAVGDVIGLAVSAMQNAVTAGLTTLQTALGAAIGLVEIAIGTLKTALEAAIGLVETAIGTLQTALEAAIGLVETALGVLEAALETAIGLVEAAVGLVQDAIEGVFTFLILALADIFDEIVTVLLNILSDLVDVGAGLFFFVYDALGLPDIFAIANAFLVGFIQFVTAIPQFIADVAAFGVAIASFFVVIGFVWIFLLPIFMAGSAGECIEKMINHASSDLTQGASLLGFRIPVPMAIPWGGLLVFTMLADTVFFGFF